MRSYNMSPASQACRHTLEQVRTEGRGNDAAPASTCSNENKQTQHAHPMSSNQKRSAPQIARGFDVYRPRDISRQRPQYIWSGLSAIARYVSEESAIVKTNLRTLDGDEVSISRHSYA
jgi:hypothetical protein